MELFREEYLTIQDDYLRVDPSREESDNDVDYSNDELGENSEITPLGDAIQNEDDVNDYRVDPDDDDFDDDDDLDIDTEEIEEEDEIMDISSQIDPDDDDFDDDDDFADDDLDTNITPDLDDDDDLLNDDDDLLSVDEDEDFDDDDDLTARTSISISAELLTA